MLNITYVLNGPEELRIMFHRYDDEGHATSVSKSGGPKVAYLYSYNGLYPIVRIENSDYATVINVLGAANIMAFRNLNPDKATIDGFVAPLKAALRNVKITSYAYKPLIGMTSETDAKGMTTFYEYDSFHRLKYIEDQAQYIGEAAEITSRTVDGNVVGSAINLNSDDTITRDGVTLSQNFDQIFTNATGSEFKPRQTGGYFMGLSVNGALLGGFGYGGGMITDAMGNSSAYFTFNGNIGLAEVLVWILVQRGHLV